MLKIGVLGATGIVGQNYVRLLSDHPYFKVAFLAASSKSAGKNYEQALEGKKLFSFKSQIANLPVYAIDQVEEAKKRCQLVFSAIDSNIAKNIEPKYAAANLGVISSASYHRLFPDVPLIIPEINPHHLNVIPIQQKNRNWKGFIIAKPNCSLQGYLIPLFPIYRKFGIKNLIVTTMQAISGAGYSGVSSFEILDNLIPFIPDEEEKSETEPLKILGSLNKDGIAPLEGISISAHCNRVPIIHGHVACVSVQFQKKPKIEEILELWRDFEGLPQKLDLPMAPKMPIIYREEEDRPQPRFDRDADNGMAISVGRLRECAVCDFRFAALAHNVLRGAAGGGVLIAELLYAQGIFNDERIRIIEKAQK